MTIEIKISVPAGNKGIIASYSDSASPVAVNPSEEKAFTLHDQNILSIFECDAAELQHDETVIQSDSHFADHGNIDDNPEQSA